MARGCQACTPKCQAVKSTLHSLNPNWNRFLYYSERTIFPGAVPVEKGEPEIAVRAPVDEL